MAATAISKKKTRKTNINGIQKKMKKFFITYAVNFANIPIRVCPASIFAKSRIERLKGRIAKEKTSITTMKSNKTFGTFCGTKSLKNFNP
jgi:hypothetical protein